MDTNQCKTGSSSHATLFAKLTCSLAYLCPEERHYQHHDQSIYRVLSSEEKKRRRRKSEERRIKQIQYTVHDVCTYIIEKMKKMREGRENIVWRRVSSHKEEHTKMKRTVTRIQSSHFVLKIRHF